MNTNLSNFLTGSSFKDSCFNFLKAELEKQFSLTSVLNMLALPCMKYETQKKLSLLFSVLEDGFVSDTIVNHLCLELRDIPAELWLKNRERLISFIETDGIALSRSQILLLADTIEIMVAKNYEGAFGIANLLYQRVSPDDAFSGFTEESLRIRLAKLTYSTNKYNFGEKLSGIKAIKNQLKKAEQRHLLGMAHYYTALCLSVVNFEDEDFKDDQYYFLKSRSRGFHLAEIYLSRII